MREIKFRIWNKATDEYVYTDEGFQLIFSNLLKNKLNIISANKYLVIEQYTGLHDKSGKEIYEGDLVKLSDDDDDDVFFISEVKYFADADDYPAFDIVPPDDDWDFQSNVLQMGIIENAVEVIGNIHENKDLVEESE